MAGRPTVQVVERPEDNRFEAHVDGEVAGVIAYEERAGRVIALHTEVEDRYKGKGVGSRLVSGMVDLLRQDGRALQPVCPFVSAWLERHPDRADVVDGAGP